MTARRGEKRFTVSLGRDLHQRIKIRSILDDRLMADMVREVLERAFPVGKRKPARPIKSADAVKQATQIAE